MKHEGEAGVWSGSSIHNGKGGFMIFYTSIYEHPSAPNIEVPVFFPLQGKWVLITTPSGLGEWVIGEFEPSTGVFSPEEKGTMDWTGHFFAPNALVDQQGRRVMWGWVRGFPSDTGWSGTLTLPRVLDRDSKGRLRFTPLPEFQQLRGDRISAPDLQVDNRRQPILEIPSSSSEFSFQGTNVGSSRWGLELQGANGETIHVEFQGRMLLVAGETALLPFHADLEQVPVRIFLDRSLVEVYVDGHTVVTKVLPYIQGAVSVTGFAENGSARFQDLSAWPLGPVFPGDAKEEIRRFSQNP